MSVDQGSARELSPSASGPKSEAVDLSEIRPGDVVAIRAYVESIGAGTVRVRWLADGDSEQELFTTEAIVSHTPKALAVGDRVKRFNDSGRIEAVCEDHAWVLYDGVGGPVTELLIDLVRA